MLRSGAIRASITVDLLPHLILIAMVFLKMVLAFNVSRGGAISLIRHLEKTVSLFITMTFGHPTYGSGFLRTC